MSTKPMFPLKLVVFPGERLNLHVFEPRYRELVTDCRDGKSTFGIPAFIDDQVQTVATEMILQHVHKVHQDGKMDIKTTAKGLWDLSDFTSVMEGKLYAGAETRQIDVELQGDVTKNVELIRLIRRLHKLMNIEKRLPEPTEAGLTFKVGHHVGLNVKQEYKLLTMPEEEERQDYMIEHISSLIPIVKEMNAMHEKVQMNGHFRNILPPQV